MHGEAKILIKQSRGLKAQENNKMEIYEVKMNCVIRDRWSFYVSAYDKQDALKRLKHREIDQKPTLDGHDNVELRYDTAEITHVPEDDFEDFLATPAGELPMQELVPTAQTKMKVDEFLEKNQL